MRKKIIVLCILMFLIMPAAAVETIKEKHSVKELDDENKLDIEIETIKGGLGVTATIRNIGNTSLFDLSWSINLSDGLIILGGKNQGFISEIKPLQTIELNSQLVFGFGKSLFSVRVNNSAGKQVIKKVDGRVIGFYVKIFPGDHNALKVNLEKIADGFKSPTFLTHANDGTNRLFVVDLTGVLYVIEDGTLLSEPFLDISDKIVKLNPIYDERGFLGLAFHPDYKNNSRFFVYYSTPNQDEGVDHDSILAEYAAMGSNPNKADPDSEKIIMRIEQPEANHNGGQLSFGPDGYLYVGLGDGGGAGDQHGDIGNGQNINTTLGSILRIDIDDNETYSVPADNPFVGKNGADEIYAYGFRNPYRFSFDKETGDLFAADVGQDKWEEINIVKKGGNYGWRILEGSYAYDIDLKDDLNINLEELEYPINEYSHSVGRSIIGGYLYRGDQSHDLKGKYVFGDWSTGFILPNGKLYYLEETQPDVWTRYEFKIQANKPLKRFILGMGEDEKGELYVLTTKTPGSLLRTGEIYRLKTI